MNSTSWEAVHYVHGLESVLLGIIPFAALGFQLETGLRGARMGVLFAFASFALLAAVFPPLILLTLIPLAIGFFLHIADLASTDYAHTTSTTRIITVPEDPGVAMGYAVLGYFSALLAFLGIVLLVEIYKFIRWMLCCEKKKVVETQVNLT